MEEQENGLLLKNEFISSVLLSALNDMRQSGKWCDLRLEITAEEESIAEEAEPTVFPVHRCIAAAACRSLAVLADNELDHAVLANLNSHYVGLCLNYIYGKQIFVPYTHIHGLLKCAQKLQIDNLVELCEKGIESVNDFQSVYNSELCDDIEELDEEATGTTIPPDPALEDVTQHSHTESTPDFEEELSIASDIDEEQKASYSDDTDSAPELESNGEIEKSKRQYYSCSQCPLKFKRVSLLALHERKHREGEFILPIFKCSMCEYSCSTRKELESHVALHESKSILFTDQDSNQIIKIEITDDINTENEKSQSETIPNISDSESQDVNEQSNMLTRSFRKRKLGSISEDPTEKKVKQEDLTRSAEVSESQEPTEGQTSDSNIKTENSELNSDMDFITHGDDDLYDSDFETEPRSTVKRLVKKKGTRSKPKRISPSKLKQECSDHEYTDSKDTGDEKIEATSKVKAKLSPEEVAKRLETAKLLEDWDKKQRSFDYIAEALGVPEDVRPLLEYSKWPQHLKGGRFKDKPRQAYRWHYIHNFKEFKCDKCDEVFKGKLRYDTHKRKEDGDFWYCSFCAKPFTNKGAVKVHEMRHMETKNVKCELCEFSCLFKFQLRKHMQNEHGENGGPLQFLCDKCPKTFKTKISLEKHELRIHNKEQWKKEGHKCPQCKYIGFSPQDVKLHMARHLTDKPFICHVCQRRAFRREKDLRKHLRHDHKQEPKLKSRKLANQDIMEKEEIPPTPELLPPLPKAVKMFKCPHCEYTTKNTNNLKAHVVIHYNERPHECPVCNLGFKRKNVMVRHAWRLHKIDLRTSCYEVTGEGRRKRKDLDNQLIVVNDAAAMAGQLQLVEQIDPGAFYEMVGADVQETIMTAQGSELILNEVNPDPTATSEIVDTIDPSNQQPAHPEAAIVFDAGQVNEDIVREVVVDSGQAYVNAEEVSHQNDSAVLRTLTVPITDSSGLTSETEIVIDPQVLKAMGLENFSAAQLKIISDTDV